MGQGANIPIYRGGYGGGKKVYKVWVPQFSKKGGVWGGEKSI